MRRPSCTEVLPYLMESCRDWLEYNRLLDAKRSGELSLRERLRYLQRVKRNPIVSLQLRPCWDRTPRSQ